MIVNLKEVAAALEISVATVSRVVNKKGNVSKETELKVLNYLKENKYVPNLIARSLKENSTKIIGVIIPDICELQFGKIVKSINQFVSERGYSLILMDTCEIKEKEEKYLELLSRQRVDGLVIATVNDESNAIYEFLNNETPVVFIDNLPYLNIPFDAILIDNMQASILAVRHLLERGHENIAIITGSQKQTTGYERLAGYRMELARAGIKVDEELIKYSNYKEDGGYECMSELLANRSKHPFTAVYITSEKMTYGAIKRLKIEKIKVPDEISVIGFDVHENSDLTEPKITTIRQDEDEIGKLVGELILKRIEEKKDNDNNSENQSSKKQKILLTPYLELGASCNKIGSTISNLKI